MKGRSSQIFQPENSPKLLMSEAWVTLSGCGLFSQDYRRLPRCTHFIVARKPSHQFGHTEFELRQGGQKGKEYLYSTSLRRRESATEQNAVGFVVLDEEEEWVVCTKLWLYSAAPGIPDHGSGRSCLRAFLIDLYEALVWDLGHGHILLSRHSRKVRPGFLKSISHS